MGLNATKHTQLALAWVILLATVASAAAQALPGCPSKCGDVEIPYPFGIGAQPGTGRNCFSEEAFNFTCSNKKLLYGNVMISSISLQGYMDMSMFVSRVCFNQSGGLVGHPRYAFLKTPAFTISSSENKFISVGCDTYGYFYGIKNNQTYATGCLTRCNNAPDEENSGICSGIGCCEVEFPLGMTDFRIEAHSFNNHTNVWDFNNCSYSFVAKNDWFNFSTADLNHVPFNMAPLVVEWAISNGTCKSAPSNPDYACSHNSDCEDTGNGFGYRCRCKPGFEGNPYHPDGCQDIDECKTSTNDCISLSNCRNTYGLYECYCPHGYDGNGTKEGGCQKPMGKNVLIEAVMGASVGLIAVLVGVPWMFFVYHKRKLMKLKERFFRQNGGFMLQQQLSGKGSSSHTAKIFTAEELKKATNNYNESLIIGRGGFGTVYKGFLADNQVVAIKKSKIVDQNQIEQFINEVVVLSQINHRNVVKLLGCCLETEVPLLVYEFVNNGTLFDYIHKKSNSCNVPLETRLRVAAESAAALSYLHSAASVPIIHRDVKTSNILLDETYTAKVSDFGASRLVPLDQTELATMVQGTLGYLDPEYMLTNQLTEKSDVYSFGVVLVELLTGKKALSFERPEEERNLAMHFLSALNQDRLFEILETGIVNKENRQMVKEVAVLAAGCLRLRGEERPSMKEVGKELDGIRMTGKHPWVNKDHHNPEETQYLLNETSRLSEYGDGSSNRNAEWDNMTTDHVLIDLNDGR